MADVSFQSSLQSLLKKSKGLKWTGPGSYNVIKRTTLTPSVPLNNSKKRVWIWRKIVPGIVLQHAEWSKEGAVDLRQ